MNIDLFLWALNLLVIPITLSRWIRIKLRLQRIRNMAMFMFVWGWLFWLFAYQKETGFSILSLILGMTFGCFISGLGIYTIYQRLIKNNKETNKIVNVISLFLFVTIILVVLQMRSTILNFVGWFTITCSLIYFICMSLFEGKYKRIFWLHDIKEIF